MYRCQREDKHDKQQSYHKNKNIIQLYLSLSKHKLWLGPPQYITTVYPTRADLPGNNTGLNRTGSALDLQPPFRLFSMNACLGGFLALYFYSWIQIRKEGRVCVKYYSSDLCKWQPPSEWCLGVCRKTFIHAVNAAGTLDTIALSMGVNSALFVQCESFVRLGEVIMTTP